LTLTHLLTSGQATITYQHKGASDVWRFTSSFTYFSRSQGSKCKNQFWVKWVPAKGQWCPATGE